MVNVIVVPQTDEFKMDVSHGDSVWISKNLGEPALKRRSVKYLAPFWLSESGGLNRIYHIDGDIKEHDDCYEIKLGNSFKVSDNSFDMAQRRRFEYHSLKSFNFTEICDGLLTTIE